ncbi:MAG: hypothetical protein WC250_00655 [Candidatus Paceibacterota bacterium]|jgi:hypothetical protein
MSKFSGINPEQFFDVAEKVARIVAANKGLAVWRGRCAGFFQPRPDEAECLLVGLPDEQTPPPKSSVGLAVTFGHSGSMELTATGFYEFVPFGGGWHPLAELEKKLEELPNFLT